ncbi:hypothetical protein ACS0TY_007216 [Phlomoides rotata]
MGEWREGVWWWSWIWRRELRERESSFLNDLIIVINMYNPKQGVADKWRWRQGEDGVYSTKAAYELLMRWKFNMQDNIYQRGVHIDMEQIYHSQSSCPCLVGSLGACTNNNKGP